MNITLHKLLEADLQIANSIGKLKESEQRCFNRLIPMAEYHPGISIKIIGIPRSMKSLTYLLHAYPILPDFIFLEVLLEWTERFSKLKGSELIFFGIYEDKIRSTTNKRFLKGRALVEIRKVLANMRVNFVFPKKPPFTERPRGYKDHGSKQSESAVARNSAVPDSFAEKALQAPLRYGEIMAKIELLTEYSKAGTEFLRRNVELVIAELRAQAGEQSKAIRQLVLTSDPSTEPGRRFNKAFDKFSSKVQGETLPAQGTRDFGIYVFTKPSDYDP